MDKQTLVRDMKQNQNGASFINRRDLAKYVGVDEHSVRPYITGLEKINKRYYFIPDVAEKMLATR